MLHAMIKYPEVVTNQTFENISTVPLELWSGVWVEPDGLQQSSDGVFCWSNWNITE